MHVCKGRSTVDVEESRVSSLSLVHLGPYSLYSNRYSSNLPFLVQPLRIMCVQASVSPMPTAQVPDTVWVVWFALSGLSGQLTMAIFMVHSLRAPQFIVSWTESWTGRKVRKIWKERNCEFMDLVWCWSGWHAGAPSSTKPSVTGKQTLLLDSADLRTNHQLSSTDTWEKYWVI